MKTILLFLVLLLAIPAHGVRAQESAPILPEGAISVEESAVDDLRIARRIRDIVAELEGYENITVSVSSGIVTLTGQVLDADAVERLDQLVSRVDGVVAIENQVRETTDLSERLSPAVDRFVTRLEQFIAYTPLLLVAFVAASLVAGFGFWLARRETLWRRIAANAFIADILSQIVRLAFSVAAIIVALDILGATALLGTFLGAAGILGLALGFAVKDSVENFIASVMLSLRQPFRPNDLVEIEGDMGRVIRLTSRATILMSLDGNQVRIPNATVFKARIVNFTTNAERRFLFTVGVDADADLAKVRKIGVAALADLPFVLETPGPGGWVERVGDSNVEFTFIGWVDQGETDFSLARSEAIRMVKTAIEAEGYALPEPIYRVKLDGAPAALAAPEPAPKVEPKPPAHPADLVDTRTDTALDEIIEQERNTAEDNLLNPEAPTE